MRTILLLLLLLIAAPVYGAIGVTEPVAEIVSTSNTATYDFGSFTPSTSSTLVIIAFGSGTVDDGAITNVSGTALTWTRKTSVTYNAGTDTAYVFWANTGGSTAASVYRVDFTGDNATACIAYFFQFTGSDLVTADPIRQAKTNAATSTNATSGTLASALVTTNGYAAGWGGQLSSTNPANVSTEPSSWTEIGDNGIGTPTSNATAAFRAGGETATSITFTNASTSWGFILVEVYAAGAGPTEIHRRSIIIN